MRDYIVDTEADLKTLGFTFDRQEALYTKTLRNIGLGEIVLKLAAYPFAGKCGMGYALELLLKISHETTAEDEENGGYDEAVGIHLDDMLDVLTPMLASGLVHGKNEKEEAA